MNRSDRESVLIASMVSRCPHPPSPNGPGDDAAILSHNGNRTRVVTTDMLTEDTHFLRRHPPELLGQKVLAVNLSDLAAMGADPGSFVLSAAIPAEMPALWWERLSEGLGNYAALVGAQLVGGDVVRTEGKVCLSVTAWGSASGGSVLTRTGGKPGDRLMIIGPVGRSLAGLKAWRSWDHGIGWGLDIPDRIDPALRHHLAPDPDLAAGPWALENGAHAAMDLSDGLLMDAPRMASASGVELRIDLGLLPHDPLTGPMSSQERASGGEDLGLLVLVPAKLEETFTNRGFVSIGRAAPSSRIGGVRWMESGQPITVDVAPFRHF